VPSSERLVVAAERFLALLDDALDDTVADPHPEATHRAALGQRELVHRFDGLGLGVHEPLGKGDLRGPTDDVGSDVRPGQRNRLTVGVDQPERICNE
jgi:hypothetical protein